MEKALSEMTIDSDEIDEAADGGEMNTAPEDEIDISDALTESEPVEETDTRLFKSVKIRKDGSKYLFDAVLNPMTGELDGYDMSDVFKVGISVEMPAKVTAFKNGTVDGKKVVFDLSDMSKETELYAECKTASKVPAIIGIVLAVGAVAAFIVLKKRK